MKATILLPDEAERITLRKEKTEYFRATGLFSTYLLPPSIVLGKGSDISAYIEIPESFAIRHIQGFNRYGTYLALEQEDEIYRIQDALGLPRMKTGIYVAEEKDAEIFTTKLDRVRIKAIQEVEIEDGTFRVVRTKILRRV